MVMRNVLSGSDPIRLEPTSAKSAVTVQEKATNSDMVSPRNIPQNYENPPKRLSLHKTNYHDIEHRPNNHQCRCDVDGA